MTNYILNPELNGIEIYFDTKPLQDILNTLKDNGFRWSGFKKCWYAKQTEQRIKLAEELTTGENTKNTITATTEQPKTRRKTASKQQYKNLWDRVQFTAGTTKKDDYKYKFVGSNYNNSLSTKEVAVIIRKELKSRFPEVKFSITSSHNKIDLEIKSSPYENSKPENANQLCNSEVQKWKKENNPELTSILNYCKKLVNSYNFDNSDSMSDYFHVNYYDSVTISYDYIQKEQTEEQKKDITEFRNQLKAAQQEEEERKEKEYQEYLVKQEEEHKQHLIRQEEEKKEIKHIYNSIEVKEIEETSQYYVIGSEFAHMNKNNTLDEYIEEVEKGDYNLQNVKVVKEIHFQNEEALKYFSNMLLNDFDFLVGTSGDYTDDNRINSMADYENMTPEERDTVKWITLGTAIYYNNKLQFIVDTSGHSYARYIGLVNNATIQKNLITEQVLQGEELEQYKNKADVITDISTNVITELEIVKTWQNENWQEYKELIKEQLKHYNIKLNINIIRQITEDNENLKVAMYRLLKEVDGIQEQFKNADLQQGQKVTLFYISDFGMISTSRITIDKVEYTKYAQYDKAVKLTFKPEGKRNLYYNHYYRDMLVYKGWLELPKTVLYNVKESNGMIISSTKYMSYDKKMYDEIIKHFQDQNILPIINTHKPIF